MDESTQWGYATKQLVAATLMVLAGLLLYSFRSMLPPVIIAALLSYVFAPLVGWFSKKLHIGRGVATLLLYLIGIGLIATVPAIIVPTIVDEVRKLQIDLNAIVNTVLSWVAQFEQIEILGYVIQLPVSDIQPVNFDNLLKLAQSAISPIAGSAFSIVLGVASGVGWVVLIAMLSFYMMTDAERIGPALLNIVPRHFRSEVTQLFARLNKTWNAFLRGQLVLCITIGVVTWLSMAAVGISYSAALGIVAGVLELIPNLGPILSSVPAILLALFQGSSYINMSNLGVAILVTVIYILIQNLENNLLVPRIIGASLNLHPLIVIIGVLAGATLGNILGVLLAAPVLASLRDILYYVYCKLAGLDPFPPPPTFADLARERGICAFLFDLDGTLLDSDDMAVERWAMRLRPVAFLDKVYDSKRLARRLIMFLETPMNIVITILDTVGLDSLVLSMGERFRKMIAWQAPHRYACVDGTIDLVKRLSQEYSLGIVTTRNRDDTQRFLKKFGLEDVFKAVVTRQDVKRLKPHPEPIRYAARELGCELEQCVMVGDTTLDIHAGKRAGALTVAVLCGFGERPELERLQPDLVLDTTSQLEQHLDQSVWYE
ncbi:MAG: AI-2E family transporter [Anaerolineae bacterium]|nr:AI-2E family transporter [Anaerolineae bacterium]